MGVDALRLAGAVLSAYLVGSIPSGYVLVRWLKRVDIRSVGSGNVGATNVTRAAGLSVGIIVFLLDLLKGIVAVRVIAPMCLPAVTPELRLGCGIVAVIGHMFPVFLSGQGGKGVATTIGVLLGTMPWLAATCVAVWLGCFLMWRYVSVGSLAAALTLPVAQVLARQTLTQVVLGAALALLILLRHRTNIERLLQGTEHQWSKK